MSQAVLTRSQSLKSKGSVKPLKVLCTDSTAISREELISLQKADFSFIRCFTYAYCGKNLVVEETIDLR